LATCAWVAGSAVFADDGIIAYRREADATNGQPAESLIVLLNFTDLDAEA
jgi:hypothetical protein